MKDRYWDKSVKYRKEKKKKKDELPQYAMDILVETRSVIAKPVDTPMNPNVILMSG